MKERIKQCTLLEADYFLNTPDATVRSTARAIGVSKSTVFKDLSERLPEIKPIASISVSEKFDANKEERAYRGGEATRLKYLVMQSEK